LMRADILVVDQGQLDIITAMLKEGWIVDPALMPTGRPNIIDGVGAVYHLVHGSHDEVKDYMIVASPSLYVKYLENELAEPPKASSEFSGVVLSALLPHGVHPESVPEFKRVEGYVWEFHKAYEKVAVWLRRPQEKGAV